MEGRFNRDSSKVPQLQKQMMVEQNRKPEAPVPDLTELMNDWFFGTANRDAKTTNSNTIAASAFMVDYKEQEEQEEEQEQDVFTPSGKSSSNSKLTQEWLEEAKRMVASSPGRCDSPSRLIGSPRFAAARARNLDRRDPLSRSAHRHRPVESFSSEILLKSAKHSRNRSETFESQPLSDDSPPSTPANEWFSNTLRPHTSPSTDRRLPNHHDHSSEEDQPDQMLPSKPPRLPSRKSRFRDSLNGTQPALTQSRRTFKAPTTANTTNNQVVLSPPKLLTETADRIATSSATNFLSEKQVLSPPRNVVESAHRRSISSSTCSLDKIASRLDFTERSNERLKESISGDSARDLNVFLKEQKAKVRRILNSEMKTRAKIIFSGPTNSTSSMVAAICYAWFLENRTKDKKDTEAGNTAVVVPVMNIKRGRMWKHRQVAWLFHHVGLESISLLFSDEVDLESLMMARKLSMLVVGQDVLQTNGEVQSLCTILTDNYCEDAYDLLQIPILKKLLLAGILLDTQNLSHSMNRDAEAVQLLLVGSSPNHKNGLYDQLMQDQRDVSFLETMRQNYGKPPNDGGDNENGGLVEHRTSVRKSASSHQGTNMQNSDKRSNDAKVAPLTSAAKIKALPTTAPPPTQAPEPAPRPKNKFNIAKWFGFGR